MVAASLWGSDLGLLVILAVCFVTAFVLATMLIGGSMRKKREMSLARRLGRGRRRDEQATETEQTRWVPSQLADVGQRFATATGFSASLDERLERAGMPVRSGEYITMIVLAAIAGAVFGGVVLANMFFAVLVAAVFGMIPHFWLVRSLQKRQNALNDQLADTLSVLASSLRAGYSFLQALDTVSKEIGEPSAHEFQRVVAEIRLGRPIDDALNAMAARIGSDDLKWAVIAINVQRQVGGNLAEVLDIVANTVRERAYIRRQIKVLSAEGRYSIIILTALPILLLIYQAIVNPDYVKLLFTTNLGLVMLVVGVSLIGAGVFWMTRLVKIDV